MRWKPHVRFGGRARETYQPRGWHRALVRPHLANQALDEVRRRTQQSTLGHRGRRADPLYRIRRRLLAAHDRLGAGAFERMLVLLDAGDPGGEVASAYLAKELLREVYATADVTEARRRLERFHDHCGRSDVVELSRLARTVGRWQPQVLAWHDTGLTNGPTEAVNLLVKKVKRVGHGFRNFDNYRLRLLLHCGVQWQTRLAASMRGRHPRLVA
jgi:transposase